MKLEQSVALYLSILIERSPTMTPFAVRRIVMLLVFCVFFLALGVPSTLLSACDPADLVEASILEGLSLTPSVYNCEPSITFSPVPESTFCIEPTIFESSLFHPPNS
jgi:hypothetical protein